MPAPPNRSTSKGFTADTDASILVQGGSLRTWSFPSPAVEQVQVVLSSEGRPVDADVQLWHGPAARGRPCSHTGLEAHVCLFAAGASVEKWGHASGTKSLHQAGLSPAAKGICSGRLRPAE